MFEVVQSCINHLQGLSFTSLQQALDMCNPNPCQQGATCHSTEGRYVCVCPDGYYSNECISLKTPCTGQHCSGRKCVFNSKVGVSSNL